MPASSSSSSAARRLVALAAALALLAALGGLGWFGLTALNDLDRLKPLPPAGLDPPGYRCVNVGRELRVQGEEGRSLVMGAEDLVPVSGGDGDGVRILITGTDDRLRIWHHADFGPARTPQGGLLAVYDRNTGAGNPQEDVTIEPLALAGFPENVAFHPHGLYFYRPASKLYVINHAYAGGGERIDVFKVSISGGKATVAWRYAISPPLFNAECMGILNDLVVANGDVDRQDELYVTHFIPFPEPVDGRLAPDSVLAKAHGLLTLFSMFTWRRWTRILYCKGADDCRPTAILDGPNDAAGEGGLGYNGINLSPDGRRLVVADMHNIDTFEILPAAKGNSRHRLRRLQRFPVPHLVDNIEPVSFPSASEEEEEGEELYSLGSVGHVHQYLAQCDAYAAQPVGGDRDPRMGNITGGVQLLRRDKATGRYSVKEVFLGDGSGLSGVSAAVRLPHGRYMLGSWHDTGVLVCDPVAAKPAAAAGAAGQGKEEL